MNSKRRFQYILLLIVAIVVIFATNYFFTPKKQAVEQVINTVLYSCNGGKTITALYYQGETKPAPSPDQPPVPGGSVDITLSDGRKMALPQTISASGVRYANQDESFVFWSKGNGALVLENNQEKTYIGCIVVAPEIPGNNFSQVYSNGSEGFSLRLPATSSTSKISSGNYVIDESYRYQALGPGKDIKGIKFTIPTEIATGTNLGADSYISVEQIPQVSECSAKLFTYPGATVDTVTDNDTTYSVATSSDAGLGNRYEETVYAISGTNPCMAIRYFIHYTVFENYPEGMIKQFDKQGLLNQFDQIRHSLIINQ